MKKIINKSCILGLLVYSLSVQAQESRIQQVLREIEKNNKELQVHQYQKEAKKMTDQSKNNLPNPTINYEQVFGSPENLGTESELTVSQSFDFPTTYGTRNLLNQVKSAVYESEEEEYRTLLRLQVKELCYDLIYLNKQSLFLEMRRSNIEQLSNMYQSKLEAGEANLLETSKIELEQLNVKTDVMQNQSLRLEKLSILKTLNGGQAIAFEDTVYDSVVLDTIDLNRLRSRDTRLQIVQNEQKVAEKQISLSRSGWLPEIELGYKRNEGKGEQFNGFVAGLSIPVFSNRKKVKIAKVEALSAQLLTENVSKSVENESNRLLQQIQLLSEQLKEYRRVLDNDRTFQLLHSALQSGQISMMEYFVDVTQIYQSVQNYMQVENEYYKSCARLMRN